MDAFSFTLLTLELNCRNCICWQVCCPPQGGSHAEVSSAHSRSVHRSTSLRRRRRPSRRWLKEQQEAEAAAAAVVSGGNAGTKMEPITEKLLTPSTEKAELGTVNGEGVQGAWATGQEGRNEGRSHVVVGLDRGGWSGDEEFPSPLLLGWSKSAFEMLFRDLSELVTAVVLHGWDGDRNAMMVWYSCVYDEWY